MDDNVSKVEQIEDEVESFWDNLLDGKDIQVAYNQFRANLSKIMFGRIVEEGGESV